LMPGQWTGIRVAGGDEGTGKRSSVDVDILINLRRCVVLIEGVTLGLGFMVLDDSTIQEILL
jgi:hypothetical protein